MKICSHCGAEVPPQASACRECGSDAETGWASEEDLGRAAWGEFDRDDYEDVIASLPGHRAEGRSPRDRVLLIVAIIALVVFLWAFVF
jgi:uncharacterized membrane protein YvbJ